MSEERQKTAVILLRFTGRKTIKMEMFPAMQWRRLFRYGKRTMNVDAHLDRGWWQQRYRLRLDGRWQGGGTGRKYHFFLPGEVWGLVGEMFDGAEET